MQNKNKLKNYLNTHYSYIQDKQICKLWLEFTYTQDKRQFKPWREYTYTEDYRQLKPWHEYTYNGVLNHGVN